jgi:hypothetical protein
MTVEELIGSLSPSEKQQAFEILRRELAPEEEEFAPPDWHAEILAERMANPDPAPPMPFREAIAEIRAELHARRTQD